MRLIRSRAKLNKLEYATSTVIPFFSNFMETENKLEYATSTVIPFFLISWKLKNSWMFSPRNNSRDTHVWARKKHRLDCCTKGTTNG
jgi:hypothetical protein